MTPEQKAKSLYDKLKQVMYPNFGVLSKEQRGSRLENVKQAVDMICEVVLSELPDGLPIENYGYWHEVKKCAKVL